MRRGNLNTNMRGESTVWRHKDKKASMSRGGGPGTDHSLMTFSFLLKVAQSCLALCNPMDYTVHGILQVRILEWVQFSSVAQSCPTLCNPMNHSTPGLPVHHQLLESTQTHVCWVSDAIQPSHPLSSPSPPALNLSQHQGLFKFASGGQSIGVSASTSVLPMNTQDWSLEWTGWISLQSKGLSRVFSNTTVQKHQFFGTQLSL